VIGWLTILFTHASIAYRRDHKPGAKIRDWSTAF